MGRGEGADAEDRAAARRPLRPRPLTDALIDHGVEFIVVGGFATMAHGKVRATKDLDICPEPSEDNLRALAKALDDLDAEPLGLEEFEGEFELRPDLEGLQAGGNWTLTTKHGRLDVMQHLDGLGEDGGGWDELRSQAEPREFLGHQGVLFAGYDDVIEMKRAAGRPQDLIDIEDMKAARGEL